MADTAKNDPFKNPDDARYFEDYVSGAVHEFGPIAVDEDEIIAFGRKFDPQDFHVDHEKARKTPFGGLIASGWHTASLMMKLLAPNYLSNASSLSSPGITNLRWLAPVRPGDSLSVRLRVGETRLSVSKPDRGIVNSDIEVINQDGVVVMELASVNLIATRTSAPQD